MSVANPTALQESAYTYRVDLHYMQVVDTNVGSIKGEQRTTKVVYASDDFLDAMRYIASFVNVFEAFPRGIHIEAIEVRNRAETVVFLYRNKKHNWVVALTSLEGSGMGGPKE